MRHPGIVTHLHEDPQSGDTTHVGVAIASHNLPYGPKEPVSSLMPNTPLDPKSEIHTGPPHTFKESDARPDKDGGKAPPEDLANLKAAQGIFFLSYHLPIALMLLRSRVAKNTPKR